VTAPGLIVAAPSTGSGKTVVTLGLLRAFADLGLRVAVAKIGPDYIDPAFLAAAARGPCTNLDTWAMRPATINARIAALGQADLILCEGVMGLFDGADVPSGQLNGSTAEIAALTGWPVVLVIDAARQGASAAALLRGFATHSADVKVIGAILNRLAGDSHRWMIEHACAEALPELPLLGWLPRDAALALPERHLGLVQARETEMLEARIDAIARVVAAHVDFESLNRIFKPAKMADAASPGPPVPPLGQRIAVARDDAFAFIYAETLEGWRGAGAEISFFSPLADEAPARDADAVYLPGGYPELHAARLAAAKNFLDGLRARADAGAAILGECGGAMVLGETLEDGDGVTQAMAGLLPLGTSFQKRKLHLGYRHCVLARDTPLGKAGTAFRAHEFHYATVTKVIGPSLFRVVDARGQSLGEMGQVRGRIMGSFIHLIDAA
jgi:cobyrinic acid a,c-diamide synthase